MSKNEAALFLRSLKEDGIEQVHLKKPSSPIVGILRPHAPQDDGRREARGQGQETKNPVILIPPTAGEESQTKTAAAAIESLRAKIEQCKLCSELAKTRNKVVFGSGSLEARVVFVGEAPGADEDEQGLPFVGRAGQLLTKIIEAMGMKREDVFICNVLKCRPPNNRPPAPEEVTHCRPYLKQQLEYIKPKVIIALGNHAVHALLQTEEGISTLRGSFQKYEGIPVMCTYHPAYLLRSPGEKRKVWEDMKKVIRFLEQSND